MTDSGSHRWLKGSSLAISGASSVAVRPLLHALLRRRFGHVQLCAGLPELADLQAHLPAWCDEQGLPTALQWMAEEPESSSIAALPSPGWLIHGNTCRVEALLQRNVCTAVRRNILATAQRLESLPDCGDGLVLLSSHHAAHRSGIAGSTLAAAEALVAAWSASHPAATVQVWRLPAAFDAEQVLAAVPPELNAAWQREALAEAFVDALDAAQPGGWLVHADAPGSTRLQRIPLAEVVHRPWEPVEAWLARLRESLERYDEDLVRRELEGLWG
jgi:hypothetical protein